MALAMKVISQVEAQRKILEEAVSTALELASGKSDGAEVAVSKTTGISVSTRYGEVENVEFNSDGALGITVYHQNRKGSASSTDLSPQAIARTVQAALDIARYTSPDPCAGVADKELLAFHLLRPFRLGWLCGSIKNYATFIHPILHICSQKQFIKYGINRCILYFQGYLSLHINQPLIIKELIITLAFYFLQNLFDRFIHFING